MRFEIAGVASLALASVCAAAAPADCHPQPAHSGLVSVRDIEHNDFHEFRDFLLNTFVRPFERQLHRQPRPARDVDASGEVPDSPWYVNRHDATHCEGIAALVRGPGNSDPPSAKGRWIVTAAKHEGVMPGFVIRDARGRRYLLKLDPPDYPELATGAEVVSSKFFYALGYNVPEDYIVTFERSRLKPETERNGKRVEEIDIESTLARVRPDAKGRFRAVASRLIEGQLVGPFSFGGVRPDDPNDRIPHEDRRELRGLYLISAWLNHTDAKSGNTLDVLVSEGGVRYIKHFLIDFGATLGSASVGPKSPRDGNEYFVDPRSALARAFTLTLYKPRWVKTAKLGHPSVGRFDAESFDPRSWKPRYPNQAFLYRLPEDDKWAARKIASFTDDEIRSIVRTGQYSEAAAAESIARTLIARRDKIAAAYLKRAPAPAQHRASVRAAGCAATDREARKASAAASSGRR